MTGDNTHYPGSTELLSIGAPVGKTLGLKKIGVHIETIPPGRRTSWPHAEKDEEEFVFVVSGTPTIWVDGKVYELAFGDFIAFPSGTGIAHTFLNNSKKNVVLLVGGESIKGSKVFYPLNPEYNEEIKKKGKLWENPPKNQLGHHNGMPNPKN